jgi:hypothetical protein
MTPGFTAGLLFQFSVDSVQTFEEICTLCGSIDPPLGSVLVCTRNVAAVSTAPEGAAGTEKRRYEIAPTLPREVSDADVAKLLVAAPWFA